MREVLGTLAEQPGQLTDRMGVALTEIEPGRLVGTMPVEGNRQPYGLLHGGASCVLAETLGSIAGAIHAGPTRMAVGIDLNATHHRAARDGLVTGVCTPLHEGGTLASYQIVLSDDAGRRLCTARLTCAIRPRPAPA
ncbi:MAG: hotdog fold thioesterase [Actinomycetota bacterium]|nr:hotdog fold thioesterase [Actinomycetota bacterium]